MTKFKKIAALMLALLMLVTVVGCGQTVTYQSYWSYYEEDVSSDGADDASDEVKDTSSEKTDDKDTSSKKTDDDTSSKKTNGDTSSKKTNDDTSSKKTSDDTSSKKTDDKDTSSKADDTDDNDTSSKIGININASSKKDDADDETDDNANGDVSKPENTQQTSGITSNDSDSDIDASAWGIATSDKGIEDRVDLKGKTIKMLCFSTINYTSASFQRTVKAFESEYGCTVKIDYAAFGSDYTTKLRNSIAANDPYDIAFMHASWSYDTIASNLYEPLNDSITTADLLTKDKKGIDLTKATEISWNGNIYGVCGYRAVNPMIIFYNKVMFQKAFDDEDDPRTLYENGKWTWDKFFELGSQVVDSANDQWFGEFNFFRSEICATYGGNCVTVVDGIPTVTIDSNKYVEGMKLISKLGSGATKIIRTQTSEDQLENFLAGKTYVYTEESDRYVTIMDRISTLSAFRKNGDNLGIVPFPLGDTNTEGLYPTGWIETACCPKGSNPDLAVAWIKFATSYDDPVTTDKTLMSDEDQAMIDKLLEKINPRRCSYSDSSWAMPALEWNLVTEAARGEDLSVQIAAYKPQMQSCIDATLSNLKKLG